MPIYEYQCDSCGYKFEYLVFGGIEPERCHSCDEDTVNRIMSTCGFITKSNSASCSVPASSSSSCGSCAASNCSGCK